MPLENFRLPKTPESRTPHVLLLLQVTGGTIGLVRWSWHELARLEWGAPLLWLLLAVGGASALYLIDRKRARSRSVQQAGPVARART